MTIRLVTNITRNYMSHGKAINLAGFNDNSSKQKKPTYVKVVERIPYIFADWKISLEYFFQRLPFMTYIFTLSKGFLGSLFFFKFTEASKCIHFNFSKCYNFSVLFPCLQ